MSFAINFVKFQLEFEICIVVAMYQINRQINQLKYRRTYFTGIFVTLYTGGGCRVEYSDETAGG